MNARLTLSLLATTAMLAAPPALAQARDGTPGNPPGTAAERAVDGATGSNMSGAAAPPAAGSSAAAPATTGTADAAAEARASLRASRIIGSNIYNEQNESVGGVDDLMLRGEGGPVVVIISVGGFLGIGARNVAVPFTELRYDSERDRWVLPGATREALQERPAFAYETTRAGAPATGTASPPGAAGGGGPAPTQRQ